MSGGIIKTHIKMQTSFEVCKIAQPRKEEGSQQISHTKREERKGEEKKGKEKKKRKKEKKKGEEMKGKEWNGKGAEKK